MKELPDRNCQENEGGSGEIPGKAAHPGTHPSQNHPLPCSWSPPAQHAMERPKIRDFGGKGQLHPTQGPGASYGKIQNQRDFWRKETTPSPAKPNQGWVLLLPGPFNVLPFPNSPFQPCFGLSALPFPLIPSCCLLLMDSAQESLDIVLLGVLHRSPAAIPAGRAPRLAQLAEQPPPPCNSRNSENDPAGTAKSLPAALGRHTREETWGKEMEKPWKIPWGAQLEGAAHLGTAPAVPGWDHHQEWEFGQRGQCQTWLWEGKTLETLPLTPELIFPKICSAAKSAAGGGFCCVELPQLFLIHPSSHQESLENPGAGAAAPACPRHQLSGFDPSPLLCSWINGIIQDFRGFPKNAAPSHHPSSSEGGTGSHPPAQDFFSFPPRINSNSPRGAEVTQEAVTSLTPQKVGSKPKNFSWSSHPSPGREKSVEAGDKQ